MKLWMGLASVFFLCLFVGLSSVTNADDKAEPIVLKVGTVASDQTPWARLVRDFGTQVQTDSQGRIRLDYGFGAVHGGEEELIRLCQSGKLAIVGVSTTMVANLVPELNLLEMPYLFNSYQEAEYIIDNVLQKEIEPQLEAHGLKTIIWSENGFKNIATDAGPISSPAAAKGLSIRCQQSPIYRALFTSMGMKVISLSVREVAQGMQTGLIDGFDNTPLFIYSSGLYHYIRDYTLTEHTYQPVLLLLSKKVYDSLPEKDRNLFWNGKDKLTRSGRDRVRASQQRALEKLKAVGVHVHPLRMEQKAAFIEATRSVYSDVELMMGKRGSELLNKVIVALDEFRRRNK